jgi:DNA (cytosine-5)-methyltransferase 1
VALTCIDAFSGAGGLSLGLQSAGFKILLSFDSDFRCIETQKANHDYLCHSILHESIENIHRNIVFKGCHLKRGDLDLLAGGPPCQGFSIQRIGDDNDERNDLVTEYFQLIKKLMPSFFLMENVVGITGKRGKAILDSFLQRADKLGYWTHTAILDAQDYGVPQRRRRFILVGERQDHSSPKFKFPKISTPEDSRITVRKIIGDLPSPPLNGKDHPNLSLHRRDRLSELNQKRLKALKEGQGREHLPKRLLANCHRVSPDKIGHRKVYGRMAWDEVAPTITARFDSFTRGQFGHPEEVRSISLREGALLQTFPLDFIFCGSKVEIARQIGNAVPPRLANAIGVQITKVLRKGKRS